MQLKISAADLKKNLKKLTIVKAENTVLDTIEGSVSAMDNELTIVVRNAALKSDPSAKLTLASKTLSSLVNSLSGELTLSFDGGPLVITSGKGKFELPVTVTPPIAIRGAETQPVKLPKKEFSRLLEFAASASDEKQRFEFSGAVQIITKEHTTISDPAAARRLIRAAGTNHHRLAVADSEALFSDLLDLNLIVPVRAAHAVRELDADEIFVAENGSTLFFGTESTSIIARKLVDKFPQYEQMLAFEPALKVQADAVAVREVLDRIAPLISEDSEHNRIELTFRGESLEVATGRSGAGTARDEVTIEPIVPDPLFEEITEFRIAANHRYLSDFFNLVEGKVTIAAKDQRSPVALTAGKLQLFVAPLAF